MEKTEQMSIVRSVWNSWESLYYQQVLVFEGEENPSIYLYIRISS